MKIFVTGSSGFIGSHLVPRIKDQHEVITMQSDLLDFQAVDQELQACRPDVIVHLAAKTEVERSFYEQTDFSQVNYVGSVNLIESARKISTLKNFVFASTMEVYGWQPISDEIKAQGHTHQHAVFNQHTAPAPNAPYAVAKYAVEKYLAYMHRSQGFPHVCVRQTNCYGRQNTDFFVMEQIISQMLRDPDQCDLGYGTPYRNFIWIDDLIDAWCELIDRPDLGEHHPIFTIGPDNVIQIQALALTVANKLGWHGMINWDKKPQRPGEIYWLNSDHELITQHTGWKPRVDLDQGIDRTIEIWQRVLGSAL
jgi:nucleoside-diphosphate-sugar epimerase